MLPIMYVMYNYTYFFVRSADTDKHTEKHVNLRVFLTPTFYV